MTGHPRKAIRDAVVQLLKDAATSAGANVFPTREVPWRTVELPGISVYALEESSEPIAIDGDLDRRVVIAIHAVTRLSEGVDDEIDQLALEIEAAMASDQALRGTALFSFLTATEITVDESTTRPVGAIRLAYEVRYHTSAAVSRSQITAG